MKLEQEGKYMEAARKYLDVLDGRKKPEEAIAGFNSTSAKAVDQLLREAANYGDSGQYLQAAEQFFEVDDLLSDARDVGVEMTLPSGYEQDRRASLDEGINFLSQRAGERLSNEDYSDAIDDFSRIIDRYDPSDQQFDLASDGRILSHVRWAEGELNKGRFRSAVEQAELATELMGSLDHDLAAEAATIRRTALEQGTIFTAMVPVWKVAPLERTLESDLLDDLNDGLQLDYWNTPPLFIALADPSLVRREVRQLGYRRAQITNRVAGDLAKRVNADIVVYGLFEEFTTREYDVKERVKEVDLRAGGDTTYVEVKGKVRYDAEIIYTIVNESGRVLDEGSVSHRENGKFERGIYEGRMSELKLNRGQRRLFDEDRQEQGLYDIEQKLIEALAEKYANEVYDNLLSQVR